MRSPAERNAPISWPSDLYVLASMPGSGRFGERLALCVQHRGRHVRHGTPGGEMWCQELPPHRRASRLARTLARLRVVTAASSDHGDERR